MVANRVLNEPISPTEEELPSLELLRALVNDFPAAELRLTGSHGRAIALTESVRTLLQAGLDSLAHDHGVTIEPTPDEVTVAEAALRIGMSQRILNRILERRMIPKTVRDGERVIPYEAFVELNRSHQALRFLTQQGQEIAHLLSDVELE